MWGTLISMRVRVRCGPQFFTEKFCILIGRSIGRGRLSPRPIHGAELYRDRTEAAIRTNEKWPTVKMGSMKREIGDMSEKTMLSDDPIGIIEYLQGIGAEPG